jgi:hypothetical protein
VIDRSNFYAGADKGAYSIERVFDWEVVGAIGVERFDLLIYDTFRVSIGRKYAAFGRKIRTGRAGHNDNFSRCDGE